MSCAPAGADKSRLPNRWLTPPANLLRPSGATRTARASVLRKGVVGIAIEPAFAWLSGDDDRVTCCVRMFARVLVWRAVATERDSAFLAGSQMDPSRCLFSCIPRIRVFAAA